MDSVLNFLYLAGAVGLGVLVGTLLSQFLAAVILVWNDNRSRKRQMARLQDIATEYEKKIEKLAADLPTEEDPKVSKSVDAALKAMGLE